MAVMYSGAAQIADWSIWGRAALFVATAAAIVAGCAWRGQSEQMPAAPLSPTDRVFCISYAPFRGSESPFGPDVPVDPRQIDEDLAALSQITDCVRTYSIDHGLDQIPGIAQRHKMKVLQGLWLSSFPELNRQQIETTIKLAQQFPDVIAAIVVGNEVLLRGEMSPHDLSSTIQAVKAKVSMPVTYADVWEFWLRYRELSASVDFVTIHILPYWEDLPIAARDAARHVDAVRKRVISAFPQKDILIGEFGWPSAGRMREAALPAPVNQARALYEVLALAKRDDFRVNLIEAFDQPWKRQLEGTVGGHWGLFDAYKRRAKFTWGGMISNHPNWRREAVIGLAIATMTFAAAFAGSRERKESPHNIRFWISVAAVATISGILIGWTFELVPVESLTAGDWLRSLAWAAVASLSPILAAFAAAKEKRTASFAQVLNRIAGADRLQVALGILLITLALLSVQAALGLAFDPRYRDFPFAPLTGAVFPLLFLVDWKLPPNPPAAELAMAATLVGSAVYIICNEGLANWQACWLSAGLAALALTLLQTRDAPS
jgi:exo-beta-1,3-glucanase (GH17 family)